MKVLHCCLAAFYIDNYGYQENILPKMHKLQGHSVEIIASTETYIDNKVLGYTSPGKYISDDGIPVERLPYANCLSQFIARKLRVYRGLSESLERTKPDIIFIHDCQFLSIRRIALYAYKNPHVRIFVDSHTDYINSSRSWVSKYILHRLSYRRCAQTIEPFVSKFYGTLPVRMDFYRDVYGIPQEKLELLVMGADQSVVDIQNRSSIREIKRHELGIGNDDLVFITGGKIDLLKNIHNVLSAFSSLKRKRVKLVVFGTTNLDMKSVVDSYRSMADIHILGWMSYIEISNLLFAADVAFFPGTHSVLWEQAVGLGIPCVFKKWNGMTHVDLGGNCIFLEQGSDSEIRETMLKLIDSDGLLESMRGVATSRGLKEFSYFDIAERSIARAIDQQVS
jgi:glycosyltransferase involved in cell wall biosynthesis